MTMTPSQKFARSVLFKSRSVKEALGEARQVFGEDAVIVSVERVAGVYHVEASGAELLAPEKKISGAASGADELVSRLEERFGRALEQLSRVHGESARGASEVRLALQRAGYSDPLCLELEASATRFGGGKEGLIKALSSKLEQLPGVADPVSSGGVFAIVGPTGSGKTTTVAKMAARAVAAWGAQSVALITTDFYRIGAYEHLRIYGELLGIPVRPARSLGELENLLSLAKSKKLILIDTIGSARNDAKVDEQMSALTSLGATCLFSLQASLSADVFKADISRWQGLGAKGVIMTKLDEAVSVGALVQSCIARSIPITHVSNGQRVPEDLHKISPMLLAHRSLRPAADD